MRTTTLVIFCSLLATAAFGQNLIVNGDFENGLNGWIMSRFDDPAGTTGTQVAPVLAGKPSHALYANFATASSQVGCFYNASRSVPVPAGIYTLRADCMWQKKVTTPIAGSSLDRVMVISTDLANNNHRWAWGSPPGVLGYEERAVASTMIILNKATTLSISLTLYHARTHGIPYAVHVDNISLRQIGGRFTVGQIPRIGTTVPLYLHSPADPSCPYVAASSFGTGPIRIGGQTLGLSIDPLLILTAGNALPQVFVNYRGVLDTNGGAKAKIQIPRAAYLRGLQIHSAYLVMDPQSPGKIRRASSTATITIL